MEGQQREKLNGIDALRGFAFLLVFVSHAAIQYFDFGSWGVSLFFVISGFLMTYNYYGKGRIRNTGFKDNLSFSWKHIKRLYLLHIVTTLVMAVKLFVRERELAVLTRNILLDVFLIQEWFPFAGRSVNDVSWYLCTIAFLYFIFPWILKALERLENPKKSIDLIGKLCFGSVAFATIGGV